MSKKRKQDFVKRSEQAMAGVADMAHDLDLSQLDTTVMGFNGRVAADGFQERQAMRDAKKAEFKEKYGAAWPEHYDRWVGMPLPVDYDTDLKEINEGILFGIPVSVSGDTAGSFHRRQLLQMREIYGDAYDRLSSHNPDDPEVVDLLLGWAERTGRWKEFPDKLQDVCWS